jgi:predicted nucleic acid-binding protein
MEVDTLSLDEAWAKYDFLYTNAYCDFEEEPADFETAFRYYAKSGSPAIQLLADAYLAAFALSAEFRLITFDKGFRKFKGVDCTILNAS